MGIILKIEDFPDIKAKHELRLQRRSQSISGKVDSSQRVSTTDNEVEASRKMETSKIFNVLLGDEDENKSV